MIDEVKFVAELIGGYINSFAQNKGYEIVNEKGIEKRLNSLAEKLFVMTTGIDNSVIREHILDYIEKYAYEYTSSEAILSDEEINKFIADFNSKYHVYPDKDDQDVLVSCIKEINNNLNSILDKGDLIILRKMENGIEEIKDEVRQGFGLIDKKLDGMIEVPVGSINNAEKVNAQPKIKSRTKEYADKWNRNMFLNNFDKRDENAGINVKLSEVYIDDHLPHYIWRSNNKSLTDLKELLAEYIDKNNEKQMLLILGQPGIGKSTLITWITANLISHNDDILVYQFSSDLGNIDERYKKNGGFLDNILMSLDLTFGALEGKTLILDGFDEISEGSDRVEILNRLYRELIKIRPTVNFKLIITCRENYIQQVSRIKCNYITLQPWDEDQIRSFCNKYGERIKKHISIETIGSILKSKEILGIPLILYMVLALDIKLEEDGSIVDVYDQIFSLEDGGIYDRCIKNINYGGPHRIKEIKEQIHLISEKIALWMFENEPDKAFISKEEYERICNDITQINTQNNDDIKNDFLIGNYFRLVKHCEGLETEELYFVHRTIYEYFVAECIFISMNTVTNFDTKEELASAMGKVLKGNRLSKEIIGFLKVKITKSWLKDSFDVVNEAFQIMLQNGMVYYTKSCYKNVIDCEMKVFTNMLDIIHMWDKSSLSFNKNIDNYIMYNRNFILNLKCVDLSGDDLVGSNLKGADFRKANLSGTILKEVNLSGANLRETDLSKADLSHANLTEADLSSSDLIEARISNANLRKAILIGSDLSRVNLSGSDLSGVKLKEAYIKEANLIGADLTKAQLSRANLIEANLTKANLAKANLRGSNLEKACLIEANLINADLSQANLNGAYLNGVKASGIVLEGTILDEHNIIICMDIMPVCVLIKTLVYISRKYFIVEKDFMIVEFTEYIEKFAPEELKRKFIEEVGKEQQ
jgi:uncharacterized protein YjbI with pentapeptide repeats/energy-coupling factor transporter ATP-binding protein EcfA2